MDNFVFTGFNTQDLPELALSMVDKDTWLADSACTSHIVTQKDWFIDYTDTPGHKISGVGNTEGLGNGTIKVLATPHRLR